VRLTLNDRASYKPTSREYTPEGYLRVPGRVARAGIQQYLARDLGITDRNPADVINVYRPPSEVFSGDSMATYTDVDVVNDHPEEMVNSESFARVSVGHVSGPATRDGDFILANLVIKDKSAIAAVESGKAELSAGYEAEYEHSPGVTEDGEKYEYLQRDIKINHVALVDKARAGQRARLFDNKPEGEMPQITLDGRTVEVADSSTATLITDIFDRKNKEIATLTADMSEMEKKRDKAQAEKDMAEEELEKKKKESSDAAISERLSEVVKVVNDSKRVAGADFTHDGVDVMSIKRAAMAKVRDSVDWPNKSDAYVSASFDMAMEAKEKESEDEDEEKKKAKDSLSGLANDMDVGGKKSEKPTPKQAFSDGITNGWKKTVGED